MVPDAFLAAYGAWTSRSARGWIRISFSGKRGSQQKAFFSYRTTVYKPILATSGPERIQLHPELFTAFARATEKETGTPLFHGDSAALDLVQLFVVVTVASSKTMKRLRTSARPARGCSSSFNGWRILSLPPGSGALIPAVRSERAPPGLSC